MFYYNALVPFIPSVYLKFTLDKITKYTYLLLTKYDFYIIYYLGRYLRNNMNSFRYFLAVPIEV